MTIAGSTSQAPQKGSWTPRLAVTTMTGNRHQASEARRRVLQEELSVPCVSNFFAIDRYWDAADKVYQSFQAAFDSLATSGDLLDDAYVYGKRYCLFCLDAIPQHNYYTASRYGVQRQRHTKQVDRVLGQLETVVSKMDVEEEEKAKQAELERKRRLEAEEEARNKQLLEWQQRLAKQQLGPVKASSEVSASALSKLELLRPKSEQEPRIPQDPSGEEPLGTPSSRYRIMDDESEDDEGLPPPVLPPKLINGESLPPPPSYHSLPSKRNFLGPNTTPSPSLSYVPPPPEPQVKDRVQVRLSMRRLQDEYRREYHNFVQQGKIRIMSLPTFQGRVDASTNGCTVISALCAAVHMRQASALLSDDQIGEIIDRQCGPILRKIRSKLGLSGHALIIPSDVHDHLVDDKILRQEDFEGAAGGNIMDEKHRGEFVRLLAVGEDGKGAARKAAATLFFREHVISIVKIVTSPHQIYYDLIDSLPTSSTGRGTRTRCADLNALEVLLRWYASRKFSEANCTYIDRHRWDDAMADFDPRVFQGFVWMLDSQ